MKLGQIGIGRKPDISIDCTRSFRVLGYHEQKLWANFCLESEHEKLNMEKGLIFRVSETGLVCEYAWTYRLGLFRVDKGHYGLAPKPKNLPQDNTQRKVTAVFQEISKFCMNIFTHFGQYFCKKCLQCLLLPKTLKSRFCLLTDSSLV